MNPAEEQLAAALKELQGYDAKLNAAEERALAAEQRLLQVKAENGGCMQAPPEMLLENTSKMLLAQHSATIERRQNEESSVSADFLRLQAAHQKLLLARDRDELAAQYHMAAAWTDGREATARECERGVQQVETRITKLQAENTALARKNEILEVQFAQAQNFIHELQEQLSKGINVAGDNSAAAAGLAMLRIEHAEALREIDRLREGIAEGYPDAGMRSPSVGSLTAGPSPWRSISPPPTVLREGVLEAEAKVEVKAEAKPKSSAEGKAELEVARLRREQQMLERAHDSETQEHKLAYKVLQNNLGAEQARSAELRVQLDETRRASDTAKRDFIDRQARQGKLETTVIEAANWEKRRADELVQQTNAQMILMREKMLKLEAENAEAHYGLLEAKRCLAMMTSAAGTELSQLLQGAHKLLMERRAHRERELAGVDRALEAEALERARLQVLVEGHRELIYQGQDSEEQQYQSEAEQADEKVRLVAGVALLQEREAIANARANEMEDHLSKALSFACTQTTLHEDALLHEAARAEAAVEKERAAAAAEIATLQSQSLEDTEHIRLLQAELEASKDEIQQVQQSAKQQTTAAMKAAEATLRKHLDAT